MLNLFASPIFTNKNNNVEAYIISLKDHEVSKKMTERCIQSLNEIGMPHHLWYAFDGTNGQDIIIPDHLKNEKYLSWIKQSNENLSTSEIALFLTHISLWAHCCTINEPIVILEHDAIMVKPYTYHRHLNSIYYLGCDLQKESKSGHIVWQFIKNSYLSIAYAHAYAIDPFMAKNLLSHVIKHGMTGPVDNFMRMDIFTVVQDDFFAYQEPGEGTVVRL